MMAARYKMKDGSQVYAGGADVLVLMADGVARTQPEATKELKRSDGAVAVTLNRLAEAGLLVAWRVPTDHAHIQARFGGVMQYAITPKGREALATCRQLGHIAPWEVVDDADESPVAWPDRNYEAIVQHARFAVPRSVFDIPRVMFGEGG
jgi:DNA-binding PadR family transcriptional regulator